MQSSPVYCEAVQSMPHPIDLGYEVTHQSSPIDFHSGLDNNNNNNNSDNF